MSDNLGDRRYRLKRISYYGNDLPILMQNENGPCPLLALSNVLILRGSIYIHPDINEVSFDDLTSRIAEYLLDANPLPDGGHLELRANLQRNLTDGMALFPKLNRGLDVNVRFGKFEWEGLTPGFEYSEDLVIFDLLNVRLLHGWLVDPQDGETARVVSHLSYNQCVEKACATPPSSFGPTESPPADPPPSSHPPTTPTTDPIATRCR